MSKEKELLDNLQDNIHNVDKFIHSALDLREYCLNNGILLKDVFVPPMRLFYEIELERMKSKPKLKTRFNIINKDDDSFISKIEKESYKESNMRLENEMKKLKKRCFFTCISILILLPFITTLILKLSL